jgi:hypothetical protein
MGATMEKHNSIVATFPHFHFQRLAGLEQKSLSATLEGAQNRLLLDYLPGQRLRNPARNSDG